MKMHAYGQDANGAWVPLRVDPTGNMGGGGGHVAATQWVYAAASGGITDTADVALAAAAGVGKANYLSSMQVLNSSATATEVVIKDGSTVIWRGRFGASMTAPVGISFDPPLASSANTALNVACITTATVTYVNAQGFTDKTVSRIADDLTVQDELYDDQNRDLYDADNRRLAA